MIQVLKTNVYCLELPFGIISSFSYINIETMNIISFDVEMHKVLANNPSNLFYCCLNNWHKIFVEIHKKKCKIKLIKRLIVYANHALLGFYLCQSRIHKYCGFNKV